MLAEFLQDAATAYHATGHDQARKVAEKLKSVSVPGDWETDGQKPLAEALKFCLASDDCQPCARHLEKIAGQLNWYDSTSLRQRPSQFVGDYCFAAIVGPGGLIESDEFRFGIYLQDRQTFYPSHKHEAVEYYLPISGAALWQKDDGTFEPIAAGTLIHHASYQPHATETREKPMLALWAWLGNLSLETYSYVTE